MGVCANLKLSTLNKDRGESRQWSRCHRGRSAGGGGLSCWERLTKKKLTWGREEIELRRGGNTQRNSLQ